MDLIFGFFLGAVFVLAGRFIINFSEKIRNKREQEIWEKNQKNFEQKLIQEKPEDPYKFSIVRETIGWRWDVLYLHRGRANYVSYRTMENVNLADPAYGYEPTKEQAIEAGRRRCEQLTQVYKWRQEKEVYSLGEV